MVPKGNIEEQMGDILVNVVQEGESIPLLPL